MTRQLNVEAISHKKRNFVVKIINLIHSMDEGDSYNWSSSKYLSSRHLIPLPRNSSRFFNGYTIFKPTAKHLKAIIVDWIPLTNVNMRIHYTSYLKTLVES